MAELTVNLLGLTFPTPILCGAGPQGDNAATLLAGLKGGAGGMITRTVTAEADGSEAGTTEGGVTAPFGNGGLLSAGGPSTAPLESWVSEVFPQITPAAHVRTVPLIASLTGSADQVRRLGPALAAAGAQALEFNTGYVTREEVLPALQALRAAVSVPIIAKLTLTHGEDLAEQAAVLEPYVDAFTCIDRFGPVLDIDVEAGGKPRLSGPGGYGYLTGTPIHPIAVRAVFEVALRVGKPVIASGGAMSTHDVVEFLEAGAQLVQVTTGAILKGPAVFGELALGLSTWLDEHGYTNVAAIQDLYRRKYGHGQRVVLTAEEPPLLAERICIRCGICGEVCYYDALAAPRNQLPTIQPAACFECGLCVSACPTGALSFRPRSLVTQLPEAGTESAPPGAEAKP